MDVKEILKHVDHRDKDCVVLAYGLYQESLKENYGIEDLVKIVSEEKTGRPPQEAGQKAERIKGIQKTGEDEVRDTSGALQKAEGRSNKTALPRQTSTDLPQEAAGQTELCEKKRQSEKNIGKQLLKRCPTLRQRHFKNARLFCEKHSVSGRSLFSSDFHRIGRF